MDKLRILVIHEVSYSKKIVYEYQLFAELLALRGHEVSVMDFDDTGDHLYKKRKYSRTGIAEVTLENVHYLDVPVLKYLTGRLNHRKLLNEKLKNREFDVVFLYSVFTNGTNTVRLCKKYKVPVVYRVLDAYHLLRRSYLMMVPLYFGERFIYRNADIICLTNEAMSEYVNKVAWKNIDDRVKILVHGVDMSFFQRKEKNRELLDRYGIKDDDKVLLFLGTTYDFCGMDLIIEKIEKIRSNIPNIRILVVGHGPLDDKLKQIVQEKKLQGCVILTGVRPYHEMPDFIRMADLSLNPFSINRITKNIIPIKILHCLAGGTPMLCTPIRDVVKYFPEYTSGVVYGDIENIDGFIEKIINVMTDSGELKRLSENAVKHIEQNFLLEKQIDKLEALLFSVVRRANTAE